jgi:5-formyltetrahydrofolate cyclo-ligase
MNDTPPIPRHQLRQHLRAQRRALDGKQQHLAAVALATRLAKQPFYHRAACIAAYLPNDGEISPIPLLHAAQRSGKRIYLPLLQGQSLQFVRYRPGLTPLHRNRLGILEPYPRKSGFIAPERIDLVLLPLVAFDVDGNRLGMGGGFYDRTFAFKRNRPQSTRPLLVGTAHQLQKCAESLTVNQWDIPMDAVATDRALYAASGKRRRKYRQGRHHA